VNLDIPQTWISHNLLYTTYNLHGRELLYIDIYHCIVYNYVNMSDLTYLAVLADKYMDEITCTCLLEERREEIFEYCKVVQISCDKEFVDTNSVFVPRACRGSSILDLERRLESNRIEDWPEFWAQSRDPRTFRFQTAAEVEARKAGQDLSAWRARLWQNLNMCRKPSCCTRR
jgi:hypothetical protein